MTCDGILGLTLVESASGYPKAGHRWCRQSVGLLRWTDLDGEEWAACSLHAAQVQAAHPPAPPCGCDASLHGPAGCRLPARRHPEGDDPMPCYDCMAYEVTSLHAREIPPLRRFDRDLVEVTASDTELMNDELRGWSEGELREAFGR